MAYANNGIMAAKERNDEINDDEPPAAAPKPLFWVGSSLNDLRSFPAEVRQVMGFALWQAQNGGKHVDAKPLKGFGGAGVLEVVADDRDGADRGIYTVKFAGAVYVLHAFQKKSTKGIKTPKHIIDLVDKRLKLAAKQHAKWRSSQQDQGGNK
jgi:phage-related protein